MSMERETNYRVLLVDKSDDTSIAAAGEQTLTLQPPQGFIYEIIEIGYTAPDPAGSGSGYHRLRLGYDGAYTHFIEVKADFGNVIYISSSGLIGNSVEIPSAVTDQYHIMRDAIISASYSCPINIVYKNDTDVAQAGTRTCIFIVRVRREAE